VTVDRTRLHELGMRAHTTGRREDQDAYFTAAALAVPELLDVLGFALDVIDRIAWGELATPEEWESLRGPGANPVRDDPQVIATLARQQIKETIK
jgi:hypothetical protein